MGAEAWSGEPVAEVTRLRSDPDAPKSARWFLWSVAARQTIPPDMETATLLVSEIVSNAIRYGAPDAPISVTCHVDDESLRCVVRNRGPRVDLQHHHHPGHGLALVAALSRRWGSRPTEDGVEVWFEV